MPDDDARLDLSVSGRPEHLAAFVQLCKTMDMLGSVGSSRLIQVSYDGDGAARLKFDFGATDVSGVEIDAAALDTGDDFHVGFD